MKKKRRDFISPGLHFDGPGVPRKIPAGRFLWHNQVQHSVGMSHGVNGFRYWHAELPVDYRAFMRCRCGVVDLPHYSRRGFGAQRCVTPEQILRNCGLSPKQIKVAMRQYGGVNEYFA